MFVWATEPMLGCMHATLTPPLLAAGILCGFAYLYMRPFIRRGLGSAQRWGCVL